MVATVTDFQAHVARIESAAGYHRPAAWALGIATLSVADPRAGHAATASARVLDTWFPVVNLGENYGSAAILSEVAGTQTGTAYLSADQLRSALAAFECFRHDGRHHANLEVLAEFADLLAGPPRTVAGIAIPRVAVLVRIADLAHKPVDAHDAYLRLHLLSHRKVKPHGQSLDGLFGLLANVCWTNEGPFDPETFDAVRLRARARGVNLAVRSVDRFPRMTDYVVPTGVRIADADRVRLGAHLAEGTVVMHEGFCNFNAGTLGKSMVEGRITAGVVVDDGSDIGGGASILGTLSGGGKEVIRIGKKCLLGANAGLGISLGDSCTVEAGLYVTASSKVRLPDGTVVKALELSGRDGILFRRNSQSGAIEALFKAGAGWQGLNTVLHASAPVKQP